MCGDAPVLAEELVVAVLQLLIVLMLLLDVTI